MKEYQIVMDGRSYLVLQNRPNSFIVNLEDLEIIRLGVKEDKEHNLIWTSECGRTSRSIARIRALIEAYNIKI
jgi:hypothetical protein